MALSQELKNFILDLKDGKIDGLHVSDRSGLELMGATYNHMEKQATVLQWNAGAEGLNGTTANTLAVANGAAVDSVLKLALTDPNNVVYDLSAEKHTVDVTPSGAAANKFIDVGDGAGFVAWSGAVTLTLTDGEATFTVRADYSTNALIATLGSGPAGKTLDSTFTITGS